MADRKISIRYARALYDICIDKSLDMREVLRELKNFYHISIDNQPLFEFLTITIVPFSRKELLINRLTTYKVELNKFAGEFIKYVVRKNRYNLFKEIIEIFEDLVDEKDNILKAHVKSAVDLDESYKKELKEQLEGKFNKNIEPDFTLDETLMAGVVVQVGDTVYDGSVKTYLNNLNRKLLKLSI